MAKKNRAACTSTQTKKADGYESVSNWIWATRVYVKANATISAPVSRWMLAWIQPWALIACFPALCSCSSTAVEKKKAKQSSTKKQQQPQKSSPSSHSSQVSQMSFCAAPPEVVALKVRGEPQGLARLPRITIETLNKNGNSCSFSQWRYFQCGYASAPRTKCI